jgi:hypothetical protein
MSGLTRRSESVDTSIYTKIKDCKEQLIAKGTTPRFVLVNPAMKKRFAGMSHIHGMKIVYRRDAVSGQILLLPTKPKIKPFIFSS